MTYVLLAQILTFHFLGDWIFQTKDMGENKGKDFGVFLHHILTYGFILSVLSLLSLGQMYDIQNVCRWIFVNVCLHAFIDFFTSKFSAGCREEMVYTDQRGLDATKAFWNCIGFDQMLHVYCLLATWMWLF